MGEPKRTDPIQGEIVHEYDGIEEADNALPRWWLLTFYGSIVFGVFYWFAFHEFEVFDLQRDAYATEMAERAQGAEADETVLATLAASDDAVAEGRETFASTCAACHGDRGQGQIGPNLTDAAWLHGGGAMDIYRSVREGISADDARLEGSAGMPAWGPPLGERTVRSLVAYLLSIRDTNVDGRAAEGEPWDPDAAPPEGPVEEEEAGPEETPSETATVERTAEGTES